MPRYDVDITNMIGHSLNYALKQGTVREYSSVADKGGAEKTLGEVIPGIVIGPEELRSTRKAIADGTPYCVFFQRSSNALDSACYSGVSYDTIFWEIQAFPGSGGLSKTNNLAGWLTRFLRNRTIPIYEFIYQSGTNVVERGNDPIAYMKIGSVTVTRAAAMTGLEGEEGRVIINFEGLVRYSGVDD